MKLINTIVGIGIILDDPFASFELGLERISSRPEEQFFGRYRTHFFGNYSPKSAFRYAVRTSMALDFEKDLCISFSIPKRENYAGAHLDFIKNEDAFQGAEGFDLHENIYYIALDLLLNSIFIPNSPFFY